MAVKVTFKEEKKEVVKEYPKLMISNIGRIILATGESEEGTMLTGALVVGSPGDPDSIGLYDTNWGKIYFRDYNQEVILKNA